MKKKERDNATMQNIILKHDRGYLVGAIHYSGEGQSYATIDVKNNVVGVSHTPSHNLDITSTNYLSCDDLIKIANIIKKQRREAK